MTTESLVVPANGSETVQRMEIRTEHIHRSTLLSTIPGIVHGITSRVQGAGLAHGNVGYSPPRDRRDAWVMRQAWLKAAGLHAEQIVVSYQAHGTAVAVICQSHAGKGADPESLPFGRADALITRESGVVVMTLHADCMPVLLCDPDNNAVATVHAGWRGTVADVVGSTVNAMRTNFGSEPGQLLAYLGPAIGGCCYEVGEDVASAWRAHGWSEGLDRAGDRWKFDLAVANRMLLQRSGVKPTNIDESRICTMCSGEKWFSHRGQGSATGRYGSFIALVE